MNTKYWGAAVAALCTYGLALQVIARFGIYIEHASYSTFDGSVLTAYGWVDDTLGHETLSRLANAAHNAGPVKVLMPSQARELAERFEKEAPGFEAVYNSVPRYVTQTDLARLLAIYYYGGLYIDADVVVRGPVAMAPNGTWFVEKVVSVKKLGPREAPIATRIANYAFAAPKRCPLIKIMLLEAARRCQSLEGSEWSEADIVWVGPDVVTSVVSKYPTGTRIISKFKSTATVIHLGKGAWKSGFAASSDPIWYGALAILLSAAVATYMLG